MSELKMVHDGTPGGSRTPRDELDAAKPRLAHAIHARGPLPRLLALAWHHRRECLSVFIGQLLSLALGLGALAGSGLAVDVVRRGLDPGAPAVRWPLGIAPPADWSPVRGLI